MDRKDAMGRAQPTGRTPATQHRAAAAPDARLHRRALLAAGVAALALPGLAAAQDFPTRPIRLVVTFPPGGSADIAARLLAPRVEARLGQPVVIDNRPGAGGNIGMDLVAKAQPDGHTIGLGAAGALAINPSLYPNMPYEPLRDLAPVTMVAGTPFVILAAPRIEARTLAEFLPRLRAQPDAVTIGHGGNGSAMHLTAELLNQRAGMRAQAVPYRGTAPATTAAATGEVTLAISDPPTAIGLIRDGRVRALAVTSTTREPSLPDVPTVAESGLAGFESLGWFGIVAPARTPAPVIARLHEAFAGALREPELRERFLTLGAEPRPSSPAEFEAYIRSETAKWAEVVRISGARAN